MTIIAVFVFYLITEPNIIIDVWQGAVEFFHSI